MIKNKPSTRNNKPVIDYLNKDLYFLITCCQQKPSSEDIEFIHSYINNTDISPSSLIDLANQHGILPLVYKTLKKQYSVILDSIGDPQSQGDNSSSSHNTSHVTQNTLEHLITDLKSVYLQISHRNMLMSAELIRIMKLLEENGIEALAFKGPVLAQMAYGDITLRQYADLDILVDEEKLYDAALLLTDHNYKPSIPLTDTLNETFLSLGHDYALFNQKNNVTVELHWTLMRKNHILHFNTFNLWKNSKYVKINQKDIKTFYTEFLLVYLCVHATKHLWARIEWITDIDRLINSNDFDWEKVLDLAQKTDHVNSLYLALSLSTFMFKTEIPSILNNNMKTKIILDARQLILSLLNSDFISHQEGISVQLKKYRLFHLLKGESISSLYAFFYVIFDFTSYDYISTIKLPKYLNFFYYMLRPIHLMKKNFLRFWKNLFKPLQ